MSEPNLYVWGDATREEIGADYSFRVTAPAKVLASAFSIPSFGENVKIQLPHELRELLAVAVHAAGKIEVEQKRGAFRSFYEADALIDALPRLRHFLHESESVHDDERLRERLEANIVSKEWHSNRLIEARKALKDLLDMQEDLEVNHDILSGADAIACRKEWNAAKALATQCLAGPTPAPHK